MKALTVRQPWASLIVEGIKDIENRTWKTNFRGRVLIHAGLDNKLNLTTLTREQYEYACIKLTELNMLYTIPVDEYTRGAIIGSVEIVDCVINHPSIWAEQGETNCSAKCRANGCEHHIDWDCGEGWCSSCKLIGQSYEVYEVPKDCPHKMKINTTYNWVLANPVKFDNPIPCKGKLSFWESGIEVCHICGQPTTKDYECEICNEYYCEDCASTYDQFSQVDYNCCSTCEENNKE